MDAKDLIELRDLLRPDVNDAAIDKLLEVLPTVPATHLATKQDLAELRGEMLAELGTLRAEMSAESGSLRAEMGSIRVEIERSTKSMIRWVTGLFVPTLVVGLGATAAITAAIVG